MFPPALRWKRLSAVEPERTYIAFSSRFAISSLWRVPPFVGMTPEIRRQVEAAPGAVGYSLGTDLFRLYFYTLSAWEDEDSLHRFTTTMAHARSIKRFRHDMRKPSIFVRWTVRGAELPLTWGDALARQRAQEAKIASTSAQRAR